MKDLFRKYLFKMLPTIPFVTIVWSIGFYILRQSAIQFNLDRPEDIHRMHLLFLGIAFFFILLPFIKTIKIGNYFELERDIRETKEEVKDFKREIRQSIQMLSTSVTASIGNLSNQVTINIPAADEIKKEVERLKQQLNVKDEKGIKEIEDKLILDEDDDITIALARTRIKLESLLRKILNKRQTHFNTSEDETKFLGLQSLWRQYLKSNPSAEKFHNSFKYVQAICNAAIHGQKVSQGQAKETIQLGALIISELDDQIHD